MSIYLYSRQATQKTTNKITAVKTHAQVIVQQVEINVKNI